MTDDINDVRHTSTLAKFEEAVRRSSPVSASLGMQGAVQYRRKDGGYGPRWITMAMFDGTLAAESYCNLQRKDDKWPFEYRAIELPAVADTSTSHESAPRAPKVRTSHHRNKEEAARLQKLVDERLAPSESSTDREVK